MILLLFQVGLESELDELLAVGASAVAVAVLGVVAPVALGYAVSSAFMPGGADWYVHLFLGATLAATSVGLTARVLKDIGRLDAPESNLILGAAVVDDILGPDRAGHRSRAGACSRCRGRDGNLRWGRSC